MWLSPYPARSSSALAGTEAGAVSNFHIELGFGMLNDHVPLVLGSIPQRVAGMPGRNVVGLSLGGSQVLRSGDNLVLVGAPSSAALALANFARAAGQPDFKERMLRGVEGLVREKLWPVMRDAPWVAPFAGVQASVLELWPRLPVKFRRVLVVVGDDPLCEVEDALRLGVRYAGEELRLEHRPDLGHLPPAGCEDVQDTIVDFIAGRGVGKVCSPDGVVLDSADHGYDAHYAYSRGDNQPAHAGGLAGR